ncbi:NUDIX hydrolase [Sinorhizobium terangae]|uniref:NUDIX domain-containing protein n=2 Tax=Sinorhizobium terangae TaxID=110322 RepID=A0A6N7L8F2_SINTE|nr:NUDIX hydrolase [Sinorhizobium terangae]MQX14002.1 NUDIX domain-containing protein [Sinorhizobium terangae]WFU50288.1 NUDIX hydrolase [Sinorhizobium terangae]
MSQEAPEVESNELHETEDVEQAGAICIRRSNEATSEVLLVASLRHGRWGLPKGHIEEHETSKSTAEREAFEEAGVIGSADAQPFGSYHYFKDSSTRRHRVTVHMMKMRAVANSFPEKTIRKTKWFPVDEAARAASQPGLRALLLKLR